MSERELHRLEVIQKLIDKRLTQAQAAEQLDLSARQIRRLIAAYSNQGVPALVSKRRGAPSNHQLDETMRRKAITLLQTHYADFGPTLAREKLFESHGLRLSTETVRQLMMTANLWLPRKQRLKRAYQPRYRRAAFGELVQIDGSDHAWFENRGPKCTLLVSIDDATGRLMALRFVPHESTFTYFHMVEDYIKQHGKPVAYSDKLGVFRVNQKSAQLQGDGVTQFGRALKELNIDVICANTCQAKGRVERANKTLQDRLVKELRLLNISTWKKLMLTCPLLLKILTGVFRSNR